MRGLYYTFTTTAWILSLCLLVFEFNRKISMAWLGHRGYWVLSFLSNLVKSVLQTLRSFEEIDNVTEYQRIFIYLASTVCTLVLALLAVFKPNEFRVMSLLSLYTPMLTERNS